jgi:CRISPR type III-B/RAMP module RAMP protein Cmr6
MSEPTSFPLPKRVGAVGPVQKQSDGYAVNVDNLHLAFYRLVPNSVREDADGDTNRKQQYLQALAEHWNDLDSTPVTAYAKRLDAQLEGLKANGHETETLSLETEGRFVAGLGYDSPMEVGCTLHPLYGFPYLPGSSVKGVARAYAEEVVEASEDDLYDVFGSVSKHESDSQKRQGKVWFFDAVPSRPPRLEVDVMTPHYGDYYTADDVTPPGEWHDPTPVPFLTVASDTSFRFPLAARDDALLEQAANWLKQGLFWLGAGGKTSSGYGLFTDAERQQREDEEREQRRLQEQLPPKRTDIGTSATDILARVLGPSEYKQRGVPEAKLDVELHVEEYEGLRVPMTGSAINVGRFEADWVKVRVDEFFGKENSIPLVRYEEKWRP